VFAFQFVVAVFALSTEQVDDSWTLILFNFIKSTFIFAYLQVADIKKGSLELTLNQESHQKPCLWELVSFFR
jgi:hypothetical protein